MKNLMKASLYVVMLIVLVSCSLIRNKASQDSAQKDIQLYVYHNGNDTLIKDTNGYNELLPFLKEHGLEWPVNWVPAPGSSRYTYYQFVNRDSVYRAYSFFLDSTILQKHISLKRISSDGHKLMRQDGFYRSIESIANKNKGYIEYDFRFRNDSVEVEIEHPLINSYRNSYTAYPFKEH
jgi:hypothetical protein